MANRYSRFQDEFEQSANFRPIYGDDNPDPYAQTRTGQATRRQEDWRDIMAHGERSDTDWRAATESNLKVLRDNYTPGSKSFAIGKGSMDRGSKNLYNATYGFEQKMRQVEGRGQNAFQGTRSTDSQYSAFSAFRAKHFDLKTGEKLGDFNTKSFHGQDRQFARIAGDQAKLTREAVQSRDESRAKWMADFNKQTNQVERIQKSQSRTKLAERFESMQIGRKSKSAKRLRTIKSRGATGLVSGAGTGLGIY